MIHPTKYPSTAHLAAHLLDAHGRQVLDGEDAARSLEAMEAMHEAAHLPANDMAPFQYHMHTEIAAERLVIQYGDRALLTALVLAMSPEGAAPGSLELAEDHVRNRLVAVVDTYADELDRRMVRHG